MAELAGLRAADGLVNDKVRPQGFLDQQLVFNPGYGVDRNYWKGHFVRELPDELIDVLIDRMTALGRPPGAILIESLHGAPKDVDPGTAALGYRDAAFNISVMADWLDPALDDEYDRLGARDGRRDRALVSERRLRQLHAGGRAARAGAGRLRPGVNFDRLQALSPATTRTTSCTGTRTSRRSRAQSPSPRTPGSSQPRWCASSCCTDRSTCARSRSGSCPKSRSRVSW